MSDTTNKKNEKKKVRIRKKEQCFKCPVEVYDLPRHLRQVHEYSPNKAKHSSLIRKTRKYSSRKPTDKLKFIAHEKPRYKCPIENCSAEVLRLPRHLSTYHKMTQAEQLQKFGSNISSIAEKISCNQALPVKRKLIVNESICSSVAIQVDSNDIDHSMATQTSPTEIETIETFSDNFSEILSESEDHEPIRNNNEAVTEKINNTCTMKKVTFNEESTKVEERPSQAKNYNLRKNNDLDSTNLKYNTNDSEVDEDDDDSVVDPDWAPSHEDVIDNEHHETYYEAHFFKPEEIEDEVATNCNNYTFTEETCKLDDVQNAPSDNIQTNSAQPLFIFQKHFKRYLEMKSLDKKTVALTCARTNKLFKSMDSDNYRDIFEVKKVMEAISSMSLSDEVTPISNQTARMYISSIHHIIKFFTRFPDFDNFCTIPKLSKLKADLEDFTEIKKKRVQEELFRKNQADVIDMPKRECLETYINSSERASIENGIKRAGKHYNHDKNFHSRMMGYFFIESCFDNGSRSGEMINMTSKEYEQRKTNSDGSFTVSVSKHKTFYMYGPAEVYFNPQLAVLTNIYYYNIRPLIAKQDVQELFLSSNGTMILSNMTRYMQQVWASAGCTTSITPSLIRKSVVTIFHKTTPTDAAALSQKFNHRLSTAYKFYLASAKKETCLSVAQRIRPVFLYAEPNKSESNAETQKSGNEYDIKIKVNEEGEEAENVELCPDQFNDKIIREEHSTPSRKSKRHTPEIKHSATPSSSNLCTPLNRTPETKLRNMTPLKTTPDFHRHALSEWNIKESSYIYDVFYDVIEKGSNMILSENTLLKRLNRRSEDPIVKSILSKGVEKIRIRIKYLKRKEKFNKNNDVIEYLDHKKKRDERKRVQT